MRDSANLQSRPGKIKKTIPFLSTILTLTKPLRMKKLIQLLFIAVIQSAIGVPVFAQKADCKSDIIFKAIQDELNRSMTELNHPEAGKPFFAGLYVTEGTFMSSRATLGAILSSSTNPIVATSYRFMFGNYDMNDENFEETQNKEMIFLNESLFS